MGIGLKRTDRHNWSINSVPASWTDENDTIVELLTAAAAGQEDLEKELFASLACKGAIREGEVVDRSTAIELIAYTIALTNPRCPHGRPLFHTLSREDLYRQVERLF
jgi:DNA mismatch repair protein MutL